MAKNVSLLGANYPDVPAVQLPQTGGGTATFYDINVVDNLTSTSATDALSANQGKVLNEKFAFDNKEIDFGTVNANSSAYIADIDISKTGYTPVLLSVLATNHSDSWVTEVNYVYGYNTIARMSVRSLYTQNVTAKIHIMYMKNG